MNRVGWKRLTDKRWEYLIPPQSWRDEVCKGMDPKLVASVLANRELLKQGDSGFQCKESIPGEGRLRVYVVSGAILDAD